MEMIRRSTTIRTGRYHSINTIQGHQKSVFVPDLTEEERQRAQRPLNGTIPHRLEICLGGCGRFVITPKGQNPWCGHTEKRCLNQMDPLLRIR